MKREDMLCRVSGVLLKMCRSDLCRAFCICRCESYLEYPEHDSRKYRTVYHYVLPVDHPGWLLCFFVEKALAGKGL